MLLTRRKILASIALAALPLDNLSAASTPEKLVVLAGKAKVPGISATSIRQGSIAASHHAGIASEMTGEPVTAATRFEAASLSKTVNALGIMRLVAEGKLDLDAPVNSQLTRWQLAGPHAGKVTTRHLLSHTGAITVHGFPGYAEGQPLPALVTILRGMAPSNTPEVANDGRPGRAFRYSGGGITITQLLAEEVTGMTYSAHMVARVFGPLKMANSTFALIDNAATPHLAGSHNEEGREVQGRFPRHPESAAAGLWTTSEDMARAVLAIMQGWRGEVEDFLPKALARQMFKAPHGGAGLGIFVTGPGAFEHSGVNYGYRCIYAANAAKGTGHVIMTNGENGEKLFRPVAKLLAS